MTGSVCLPFFDCWAGSLTSPGVAIVWVSTVIAIDRGYPIATVRIGNQRESFDEISHRHRITFVIIYEHGKSVEKLYLERFC